MRRRRVVGGPCNPASDRWSEFESIRRRSSRCSELIRQLVQSGVVQPDDVSVIVGELCMVVIVRPDRVWLDVSVNRRVRMVSVGLVSVLPRQRPRQGDVGCQYQADDGPAQGTRHYGGIMAVGEPRRQTPLSWFSARLEARR